MRLKSTEQQYFDFSTESSLKIVTEYRQKYRLLSHLLDENPQLVSFVHQDVAKLLSRSKKGVKATIPPNRYFARWLSNLLSSTASGMSWSLSKTANSCNPLYAWASNP